MAQRGQNGEYGQTNTIRNVVNEEVIRIRDEAIAARYAHPAGSALPTSSTCTSSEESRFEGDFQMKDLDGNGSLVRVLGSLTPPMSGLSLSNSGEIKVVEHFGRICIHNGFEAVFATILFPQSTPGHVKAHAINPDALVAIGRPKRRELMEGLSKHTVEIRVVLSDGIQITDSHVFHQSGSTVTLATMMAVGVALRDGNTRWLFAELVGLALPNTIDELMPFCQPPFLTLRDIPRLVHAAARSIVDHNHGGSSSPSQLAIKIGDVVCVLLDHLGELDDHALKDLGTLFEATFQWTDDEDRGAQVGLMLAGIKKYMTKGKEELSKKIARVELVVDVLFGGLSAIPLAGVAFSTTAPLAKAGTAHVARKQLGKWDALNKKFKEQYDEKFDCPIARNGRIYILKEDKRIVEIRVVKSKFKEWLDNVMYWNTETL